MLQSLRLTCGTETIHLSSPEINLRIKYIPIAPSGDESITESVEVHFSSRNMLNRVNQFFELARRFQSLAIGNAVYVEFKPDVGDTEYYRSEITDGKCDLNTDGAASVVDGYGIEGIIIWTRKPYWEGEEVELPLNDASSSNITGGLTVYNPHKSNINNVQISYDQPSHEIRDAANGMAKFKTGDIIEVFGSTSNDFKFLVATGNLAAKVVVDPVYQDTVTEAAGDVTTIVGPPQNYVDILADDVLTDLPAPIRLKITNNYNSVIYTGDIYVAHNIFSDASIFNHILECEDLNSIPVTANVQEDAATSSQGRYLLQNWATTGDITLGYWLLSNAQMNAAAGNMFRALLVATNGHNFGYSDIWYKLQVTYWGTTVLYETEWKQVDPTAYIAELGTIRLPPFDTDGNAHEIYLELHVKYPSNGGLGVAEYLDFIQLCPMDGYRALRWDDVALPYEYWLMDDMIKNKLFSDGAADPGDYFNYFTSGAPILIAPNKDQRLYFLWMPRDVYRTLSIQVYYRPRRSTI